MNVAVAYFSLLDKLLKNLKCNFSVLISTHNLRPLSKLCKSRQTNFIGVEVRID